MSDLAHCVRKILELVQTDLDDRRALLQLGYNLGRLSELTGEGRELYWDLWKGPVADGDVEKLRRLACELQHRLIHLNDFKGDGNGGAV